MNATIAVRPHRPVRWIGAILLVAAIVATVVLSIAVFTGGGSSNAPATPAPVSHTTGGVDTYCLHRPPTQHMC